MQGTDSRLAEVRSRYDRWAEVYDDDGNPLPVLEQAPVRRALGPVAGLEALDLGCGTGRHALWLASQGAKVTAVDFSAEMLARARAKPGAQAVRFVEHDLHRPLPFENASFDRVVSGLVLEHIEHLGRFYFEARRVLRPSGLGVFSTLHPSMFLRGSRARFLDPSSGESVYPGSNDHSLSDVLQPLLESGLALRSIEEASPTAELAARHPRAEKHMGWPMLLVLTAAVGTSRA